MEKLFITPKRKSSYRSDSEPSPEDKRLKESNSPAKISCDEDEVWGRIIPCSAPSTFKTLKSISKNQRSRKGTQNLREEILSDKNFEELIRLVKSLVVKIDKLDSDSQSRHDVLGVKLQQLKSKTANLSGEIHDLQLGLDFTNEEVEMLKDTLSNKLGLPF